MDTNGTTAWVVMGSGVPWGTDNQPHTWGVLLSERGYTHTQGALLSGRGHTQSPATQAQVREDREALVTDCRRAAWGRPFHLST